MTYRTTLIATCWMLMVSGTGFTAQGVTSPEGLLDRVPALMAPMSEKKCTESKTIAQEVEKVMARENAAAAQATPMYMSGGYVVTDAQCEAIARLTDEKVTQCLFDTSLEGSTMLGEGQQRLRERSNALHDEYQVKDSACGSGIGMDPVCAEKTRKEYRGKLAALSESFYREMQSPFGAWRKKAHACLQARETAVDAVLKSGAKGPFVHQAKAIHVQSYSIPQAVAQAHGDLCEAALEVRNSLPE